VPKSAHMTDALARPRSIVGAVVAGVVGGAAILACLAIFNLAVLHTPGFSVAGLFAFDASVLVGKIALTSDAYVPLGAALHFLVAMGWAGGYSIAAERQVQLLARPIISGAAFGLIVYFAMQLVLVAADLYQIPTPAELGVALLAHIAFYGVPVALIVARVRRRR
jgi:hypothetical protein